MFKRILVAYDESPASGRAQLTGIHLAKNLNAELRAESIQEKLPPYSGYIEPKSQAGVRCSSSKLLSTIEGFKPRHKKLLVKKA